MASDMTEARTEVDLEKTLEKEDGKSGLKINPLHISDLLQVKVKVDGLDIMALIDTGASNTLIRSRVIKTKINCINKEKSITGIGGHRLKVMGEKMLSIDIGGNELEWKCLVMDNDIGHDMILGNDFLRHNKVKINLKRRQISFQRGDKALVRMKVNDEGEVSNVMIEKVPVYCKENVKIKENHMTLVPIEFAHFPVKTDGERLLYYEADNGRVESLDGVMLDGEDNNVWVQKACKKRSIKKGEILGYVNSMFVTESNPEKDLDPNEWNEERISNEIVLGNNLSDEEKEKVQSLLLDWKEALSKGESDLARQMWSRTV